MSTHEAKRISRRRMLGASGTAALAGAAAVAAPGSQAEAAAAAPRWVMVMDLRRCVGCRACTISCKTENSVPIGNWRTVVQEKVSGTFPNTKKGFLPLMCNHCEGNDKDKMPPCIKDCPQYPGERAKYTTPDGKTIRYRTGGTYKRPDGMVLIDNAQCIGCGKCITACPYGVRSFNPLQKAGLKPEEKGVTKCSLCQHRVDNGVEPACVNTCQGRARIFGDLNDPSSEVAKLVKQHKLTALLPDEGTKPHVFYIDPDNLLATVYKKKTDSLDHFRDEIT